MMSKYSVCASLRSSSIFSGGSTFPASCLRHQLIAFPAERLSAPRPAFCACRRTTPPSHRNECRAHRIAHQLCRLRLPQIALHLAAHLPVPNASRVTFTSDFPSATSLSPSRARLERQISHARQRARRQSRLHKISSGVVSHRSPLEWLNLTQFFASNPPLVCF